MIFSHRAGILLTRFATGRIILAENCRPSKRYDGNRQFVERAIDGIDRLGEEFRDTRVADGIIGLVLRHSELPC
jgi:hypothetical protein